ncbi:ZIP family metal transporter [Deinococcus yavapaiensis]|nr:ZIP family zinc transporter [Deinococcus yavapaiensis]
MAFVWGALGGLALLIGALIGLYVPTKRRVIGYVMALGAGVLISSVAFELVDEAAKKGGLNVALLGLVVGAVAYWFVDRIVSRRGARHRKRSGDHMKNEEGGSGLSILVGSLMDGIPESVAIGASLLGGSGVSLAMVVAVFLSNVPESLSSAVGMKKAGYSTRRILVTWTAVLLVSGLSSWLGYVLLGDAAPTTLAFIQCFAAGAIITMLASTMLPEAHEQGGPSVGLVTTLGFLAAFVLSRLG